MQQRCNSSFVALNITIATKCIVVYLLLRDVLQLLAINFFCCKLILMLPFNIYSMQPRLLHAFATTMTRLNQKAIHYFTPKNLKSWSPLGNIFMFHSPFLS
jgi:hypothetical protein